MRPHKCPSGTRPPAQMELLMPDNSFAWRRRSASGSRLFRMYRTASEVLGARARVLGYLGGYYPGVNLPSGPFTAGWDLKTPLRRSEIGLGVSARR